MKIVGKIEKGAVRIPSEFVEVLHLKEGVAVSIEMLENGSIKIRKFDPDQEWYWKRDWQEGEAEAKREIEQGQTEFFKSGDEFLRSLRERAEDRWRRRKELPAPKQAEAKMSRHDGRRNTG